MTPLEYFVMFTGAFLGGFIGKPISNFIWKSFDKHIASKQWAKTSYNYLFHKHEYSKWRILDRHVCEDNYWRAASLYRTCKTCGHVHRKYEYKNSAFAVGKLDE